jgi:hypothetical protein
VPPPQSPSLRTDVCAVSPPRHNTGNTLSAGVVKAFDSVVKLAGAGNESITECGELGQCSPGRQLWCRRQACPAIAVDIACYHIAL